MKHVEKDIVEYLAANVESCNLEVGRNIFYGPTRIEDGITDRLALFCTPYGGYSPESFVACDTSRYRVPVQLWLRAERNSYSLGHELMRECAELLQSDRASVIDGYLDVQLLDSYPLYYGRDDSGYHEFSLSVMTEFFG